MWIKVCLVGSLLLEVALLDDWLDLSLLLALRVGCLTSTYLISVHTAYARYIQTLSPFNHLCTSTFAISY